MKLKKINPAGLKSALKHNCVILYYAPWCHYCKKMEPVYQQVAMELDSENFHLAKCDMHKYRDIIAREAIGEDIFGSSVVEDVKGYPTVICYKDNGERSVYNGPVNSHIMRSTFKSFYGN